MKRQRTTPYYIYSTALTLLLALALAACWPSTDRRHMEALVAEADSMNRNYVDFTTDSNLLAATRYFDRHGTPNERMKAHYLLGCAYRDMGEAPRALAAYHDAIDCADTTATNFDYLLLAKIHGQMADLFHAQNLPREEIEANKAYGDYSLRGRDTLNYIQSVFLLSGPYYLLGDTTKTLLVIKKARQLYLRHGYVKEAAGVYNVPIFISILRGQLDDAVQMMKEYEEQSGLFDSSGNIANTREWYYYTKGLYYLKIGQTDSAEIYMRRLLHSIYECDAYRGLLDVFEKLQNTDSIVKYAHLYENAVDTLHNRMRTEAVNQTAKLYNYQRFQKIAIQAKMDKERTLWIVSIIVLLMLIGFVVAIAVFLHYRRLKQKELLRLQTAYATTMAAHQKACDEKRRLESNDATLLELKQQEIEQLQYQLDNLRKQLMTLAPHQSIDQLRKDLVVKAFRQRAKGLLQPSKPTEQQWERLNQLIKEKLPRSYATIGQTSMLTPLELRTTILTLLGFSNAEICTLLMISPQQVSNLRLSVNRKLFSCGSAVSLKSNLEALEMENG